MAEAMLAGKPVIATGYSGNLEFMDEANSFLVGYDLVPIPEGCDPYPAGARWAEPDLDEAAGRMRRIVEDPAGARAVAERGRRDIDERHRPAARGPLVAARLAAIRAAAADARPAAPALSPTPVRRCRGGVSRGGGAPPAHPLSGDVSRADPRRGGRRARRGS